jgi:aminoglycoside 3-N-acetyltransferase
VVIGGLSGKMFILNNMQYYISTGFLCGRFNEWLFARRTPEDKPLDEVKYKTLPPWKDGLLIAGELLAKRLYRKSAWLRKKIEPFRWRDKPRLQTAKREEFKQYLREIGVDKGALVMAHTAVSNLRLYDESPDHPSPGGFLAAANNLVNDLLDLAGPTGTLVMPAHAHYQGEDALLNSAQRERAISYDPQSTPCAVGLANELFWRRKGVLRSLHPYNSLAAYGPLAEELLHDNLNHHKPLPQGIYSGYYRFSRKNGIVISIGVPLQNSMTLIHTPEEVRDQDWPIKDFFEERRYLVRINGRDELYVVRQRRPQYGMYCICVRKAFRDLVREGIVHETSVGSVRVDWAWSRDVFDFFMKRNKNSHYPYYGIRTIRAGN